MRCFSFLSGGRLLTCPFSKRAAAAAAGCPMANRKKPLIVTVTGAAGQIGYAIIFQIAAGRMLGPDQPIELRLLDLSGTITHHSQHTQTTPKPLHMLTLFCPSMCSRSSPLSFSPVARPFLNGVVMELEDCAFPLLTKVVPTDDPKTAFEGCDIALLIGARPRGPGMTRADLLKANAGIFKDQGKALNDYAARTVKVLVVGNPANTVRTNSTSMSVFVIPLFPSVLRVSSSLIVPYLYPHLSSHRTLRSLWSMPRICQSPPSPQ